MVVDLGSLQARLGRQTHVGRISFLLPLEPDDEQDRRMTLPAYDSGRLKKNRTAATRHYITPQLQLQLRLRLRLRLQRQRRRRRNNKPTPMDVSARSMSMSMSFLPPACSTSCSTRSVSTSPSPRPRRRASQGSVSTQRVQSRFLSSKDTAALHSPFLKHSHLQSPSYRHSSRAQPMSLDTALPRDPSRPDHTHSLPLTPPADEEDEHAGWVMQSVEPKPQVLMDESRDRHSASPTQCQRDSINSSFNAGPDRRQSNNDDVNMSDQDMNDHSPSENWLENGIKATLSSVFDSNKSTDAVRLVSQTLPYPRAPEHNVRLPTQSTVFGTIIENIQDRLRPENPPYIHVVHAVPEDFSLSNLPTSPSSTPGNLMQMDNYFDSRVFSSASTVPAYHDVHGNVHPVNWPHPIVPPYSIHISVLERYIPPSTQHEYRDLFAHGRPSVLTDRLHELSPSGGCLLFIYPTRIGAMTFKSQYLGPILDPLLRQLVVVNGFSADVSRDLGRLVAVNSMDDFETMKANVEKLCRKMSSRTSKFTVVDAGKGLAPLDRNLWTEWYIQQERPRIKFLLSQKWQTSGGRHTPTMNSPETSGGQLSSSILLSEIIDGIKRRQYEITPRGDIELGVFVIRRSH
ncbi:hypothetical protein UA08_01531 [Talaromyces atroroseus]|uniref:Uncharacterized protein n=1 Tax=Talaromyces atroroseus TaxID=1441469 RepID=A0A1Q5QBL8_TALAT|nr:hypothetical protein UA08_01531 [Talaromyces atroroseus]OKL63347.1 hypothetical protein UA08_01531 [Talaromyces atroroseus]